MGFALLALLATVPFFPALRGGHIIDDAAIAADTIGDDRNFRRTWWRYPRLLTRLTHQLTGRSLVAAHLFNIGLHLAAVETVYSILTRTSLRPGQAIAAAAIFAVHPLQVQAVAYVGARAGLLSFLFAVLVVRVLIGGSVWGLVSMPLLVYLGWTSKEDFAIYLLAIAAGGAWLTWA